MAFGWGDIWDLLSSRPAGMAAGYGMSQQEQEEWDQDRARAEGTAEEGRAGRGAAWGVPGQGRRPRLIGETPRKYPTGIGSGGGGYLGAVGRVSRRGLAESEEFYERAPQRFNEFADPLRSGLADISTEARGRYGELEGGYADLEREGRAGAAGLVTGQEDRERRLMEMQGGRAGELMRMLEGAGEQERRDIQQAYSAVLGDEQVRLGQMGLMGTGVASSHALNIARERTGALGRQEERLRGERLGLAGELGTERLGMAERLGGQTMEARAGALDYGLGLGRDRLGIQGDVTGAMYGMGTERLGFESGLGAAGLQYGDEAWGRRQADRERYGLMPAEAGLAEQEDWRRMEFDEIQYQPPYGGQGAGLWDAAGRRY